MLPPDLRRFLVAFPVALLALVSSTAFGQAQSKDQQKCINKMNKDGTKIVAAQGRGNTACVKDAGRGRLSGSADACLTADRKGKVARATAKAVSDFASRCGADGLPDFGLAPGTPAAVSAAGISHSLSLVADVFGSDLSAGIVACDDDQTGCGCQAAVSKSYEKVLATALKVFLKCKKNALKGGASESSAIGQCVTGPNTDSIAADAKGKIEKAVSKLRATVDRSCAANVFPGSCAELPPAGLGDCIRDRVDCRLCLILAEMDDLTIDCDGFDDGVANESCATVAADLCDGRLTAFEPFSSLVTASCDATYLHIDAPTGLADPAPAEQSQRMMVGIVNWILRVPIPFDYDWRIPLDPVWSSEIVEASPRGPIAVAVNGVPIFHYEARPDVSTHPEHYDPGSDTVVQGELDHCGGHAGQGDDYHYHYAPICLLGSHDLAEPIAYGLDGAPVYFGTGGTDFYGDGLFNHIDNLPAQELDLCNAIQLAGGGYAHYTTSDPPYLIGCHHGVVDADLQIEPRPMREQGVAGAYGGVVGEAESTLVTDWYVDEDGWMHLEHDAFAGGGTSAVLYRQAQQGDDCWDFEFRGDASSPGVLETYCRPQ